jgi:DNA modification methylase
MEAQKDLFGNTIDDFKSQKEKFGIWPLTVWDCDLSDPEVKAMKQAIGDLDTGKGRVQKSAISYTHGMKKQAPREGCFSMPSHDASTDRDKVTISIFNPAVAAWILNLYAPTEGLCFDPFAGGGTRAIMAAKHGMNYVGVELREEEVDAVVERCKGMGVQDKVGLIVGDSSSDISAQVEDACADFLITCPPYYDLEVYGGGEADLSMVATYQDFLVGMQRVIKNTYRVLKPGAYSCWVVGLHRDKKGNLLAMNHDISRLHQAAGFRHKEEVILAQRNNGAIQRVGNFEKGDRRLIRTHEYLLVFVR